MRVVNIKRAASGDEFHQAGDAVVVADIERNGDALNSGACTVDGKSQHPNQVPEAASFVLAGHAGRQGQGWCYFLTDPATFGSLRKSEKSEKSEVSEGGVFSGKTQKMTGRFICNCLHKSNLQ